MTDAAHHPDASPSGFLVEPPASTDVQRIYDSDLSGLGYVMNATRLWAQQPLLLEALAALIGQAAEAAGLSLRQRGVLITSCASALGDSYCALAWGNKLAGEVGAELAAEVLRGDHGSLDDGDRALAQWARKVTTDPNATSADDAAALRAAGFDDAQILAITAFVGLRLAFSTVNDALGARPDAELGAAVPVEVRDAVTFGRPPASA